MWMITGDWHLSSNQRDAYRFEFLKWLAQLIKERPISRLIVVGDITNEKDRHDAWLVNEIADWIASLTSMSDPPFIDMLKGNHDYLVEHEPFFQFLDHIKRVRYYSNITEFGEGSIFLPHTRNYKTDWAKYIKGKFNFKYVFAHQTFEGADVGSRSMEGIPLSIFGPKVKVFSGDIHVPQTTGPVTYIGAPYTVNFGDTYQGRVILLDPENGKVVSIPYKGPQKRLVECKSLNGPKDEFAKGDILKIRVHLSMEEYENWKDIRSDLKRWAEKRGYVIHTILPVVPKSNRKVVSYKKIDPETDLQLVKTFAKRSSASDSALKIGLNIMKET